MSIAIPENRRNMAFSAFEQPRFWNRFVRCSVVALLAIHGVMLGWISYVNSPNLDEPAHLVAGISHWRFARFDLYRVNPPLVRMVAAVPAIMRDVPVDWSGWNIHDPYARSEFGMGTRFVRTNGSAGFWYFTLSRWACIPLCLAGLWVVYLWARDLYGVPAGLMAISLYCFCPNCLAWGASITPDAAGASMGVVASYLFWKWLSSPTWGRALLAGLTLGIAELTKGTWIVLWLVWPILWLAIRITSPARHEGPGSTRENGGGIASILQLVSVLMISVYVLNLGYHFEGSFRRLGDYKFVCRTLSGEDQPPGGANRFGNTWLGSLRIPLPENYVRGLDIQKLEFERGKWSYLCGDQRRGGWWYYYLVAFLVKTPLGTLLLFVAATGIAIFRRDCRSNCPNELLLLLPAAVILILVSSQTGFSRYLRYALPVLPFVFIHTSRVAAVFLHRGRVWRTFVIACCLGTAIESLSVFPHSMSFFNRAVGGPLNGHAYLLDANIDWGQDLLWLKQWYDRHPEARPFHLAYFDENLIPSSASGIRSEPVPGFLSITDQASDAGNLTGPQPGWFAVSINHVKGYRHYDSDPPQFTYFQLLHPVARAGYSIWIYHLTLERANLLRAELGLKRIDPDDAAFQTPSMTRRLSGSTENQPDDR